MQMAGEELIAEELVQQRKAALLSFCGECITEEDLESLLRKKEKYNLYDGFEPSGRMHIAQGLLKAKNVRICRENGGDFIFWVADWFALMNDKMSGDLDKIKVVGQYFIEVWKACGMDAEVENVELGKVIFKWTSEEILDSEKAGKYWGIVFDIARKFSTARIMKCCQIMGRKEGSLSAAQLLYPLMQCADIFHLKADICQLGLDQRKVNMLAREYCDASGRKVKPVILSQPMISGLKEGQAKMSKSDPDSAIFMEDEKEDIERKIANAHFPAVLEYLKHFTNEDVTSIRDESKIRSLLSTELNRQIEPVRTHFNKPEMRSLLEKVQEYRKTAKVLQAPKVYPHKHSQTYKSMIHLPLPQSDTKEIKVSLVLDIFKAITIAWEATKSPICILVPDLQCYPAGGFSLDTSKKAQTLNPFAPGYLSRAYFSLLVKVLREMCPEDVKVDILWESELFLEDVNAFMLNAIQCGRSTQLNELQESVAGSERVGPLIAALLRVASVQAINPEKLYSVGDTEIKVGNFVGGYLERMKFAKPGFTAVAGTDSAIQPGKAEDYFLFDTLAELKKKVKRSFCEPGNIKVNPTLAIFGSLLFIVEAKTLADKENELKKMVTGFEDESVHPKDLKDITASMIGKFCALKEAVLTTPEGKKEVQTLKKYAKRVSK